MNADLHLHSTWSDGSLSVAGIVAAALERRLDCVSVTDHDTTDGTAEALALGRAAGIAVIPGIEISAFDFKRRRKVHLLGYGFRDGAPALNALCAPLLERRHENSLHRISLLAAAGYPVSRGEAQAVAGPGRVIYKQHIMAVLAKKGATHSIHSDLYRALFKNGGICAGDIEYLDVFAALRAVHEDEGKAVLAHPGQLDSWEIAEELVAEGLDGIEYYHESHSTADFKRLDGLIAKHPHLFITGGSDFHGSFGSGRHGIGDIRAPAAFSGFTRPYPDGPAAAVAGIVREAGALLRRAAFEPQTVRLKSGDCHDVVTDFDLAAEELLIGRLRALLPGSGVVSEESDDGSGVGRGPVWIIDPIDGTINFLKTKAGFSVSVALYEGREPRFGFVYDVMADALYFGAPGRGAFRNGERLSAGAGADSLAGAVIDVSLHTLARLRNDRGSPIERLAARLRGHRSSGCASLALCRIAEGRLDAYAAARIRIWDYAAAAVVLTEAGGCFAVTPPEGGDPHGPRRFAAAANAPLLAEIAPLMIGGEDRDGARMAHPGADETRILA